MLAALWALLLSDVRLTSLPSAPRFGDDRSALLRGGAQSQTLREWSDSDADALWENVSTVWADVSALWNRTRREEALRVAASHATPLLLELGERIPAGEYSLPLDESTKLTLHEVLDGSKLTLAARRPRRIRKPELAALAQAVLDALGSQLTVAALGGGRRWVLPPDGARLEFNASAVRLLGEWGNGTDKAAEWARAQLRLVLGWEHMGAAGPRALAVPASRAELLASVQGREAAPPRSGGGSAQGRGAEGSGAEGRGAPGRGAEELPADDLSDDELLQGLLHALEARLLAACAPSDGASSWRTYEADGAAVHPGGAGSASGCGAADDGEDAGYSLEAADLDVTLRLAHAASRPAAPAAARGSVSGAQLEAQAAEARAPPGSTLVWREVTLLLGGAPLLEIDEVHVNVPDLCALLLPIALEFGVPFTHRGLHNMLGGVFDGVFDGMLDSVRTSLTSLTVFTSLALLGGALALRTPLHFGWYVGGVLLKASAGLLSLVMAPLSVWCAVGMLDSAFRHGDRERERLWRMQRGLHDRQPPVPSL